MPNQLITFIVAPIASHLYASFGVARRLKKMGHRVEFWGDAKIAQSIQQEGFEFRALDGLWPMWAAEIEVPKWPLLHPILTAKAVIARRRWRAGLPDAMTRLEAAIHSLLKEGKPDLVIFDPFRLAYYPFFRRKGIPGVVLSTKALATPDPWVPPHNSSLLPQPTWLSRQLIAISWTRLRLVEFANRCVQALARCLGVYTYNDLVVTVGELAGFGADRERVRRGIWYDLHFRCMPEWVLWTPDMDFPRRSSLPGNICFIGPCVDFDRRQAELPTQRKPETRHLVYVAMGTAVATAWEKDISLLNNVMHAFGTDPQVEVWIATGDARVTSALGVPPPNVRVFDFLPQLRALGVADLAITHAGASTLRECILHEVPMLAYPRDYDQFGNSARIVHHGLGLRGSRTDSSTSIRQRAMLILNDDGYRSRLRALKASIEMSQNDLLARALEQARSGPNMRDHKGCQ